MEVRLKGLYGVKLLSYDLEEECLSMTIMDRVELVVSLSSSCLDYCKVFVT